MQCLKNQILQPYLKQSVFYFHRYYLCASVLHPKFYSWQLLISFLFKGLALQKSLPMNYYTVFHHIRELIPKDCILVSEGANTMDIGRTMLPNFYPRQRCDIFCSDSTCYISA